MSDAFNDDLDNPALSDAVGIGVLRAEVYQLRKEVRDLNTKTTALVDAWTTGVGVVRFIKVLSSIVAGIGVLYFFLTHGFTKAP